MSIFGCSFSDLEKIATDVAIDGLYDESYEKKSGMTEWEYEQKLKWEQKRHEEEQRQFNLMKNQ